MMILPRSDSISRGQLVSISCVPCALLVVAVKSAAIASSKAQTNVDIRIQVLPQPERCRESNTIRGFASSTPSLGQIGRPAREVLKSERADNARPSLRSSIQNLLG